MGFIKAFAGSLGGVFADQWLDFITVPSGVPATAAFFPGVNSGRNAGRGSNTKGSENLISNGSKIVVPEGYGLMTFQDGRMTGFVAEAGGFIFNSDDPNAKSVFADGGVWGSIVKNTWERFKYGGRPGSQQQVFFVNLKEIPDNKFGTQSEIYWDDAYLGAQVGAVTRGSYTLQIVDPILFVSTLVPANHIANNETFDLADMDNPVGNQLFTEVVGSLSAAFSKYTNDPAQGNRITRIQQDSVGFAQSLSAALEENYQWLTGRGIEIKRVALAAIEYDEDTKALLSDVKRADALRGDRGGSFLQQSVARGIQAAGENGGTGGIVGMGMGVPMMGGVLGGFPQQGQQPQQGAPAPQAAPAEEDPVAKLKQMKELLDAGVVTQEEFDALKKRLLGL
ncbi:SHOCT domain-containing protein [Arachnia propionica]|uniref:SPFH domain-containing protein n=1 Tax=Arachnia propionica TaxID=1750 RepID=A0A3P1X027_9ACTN|nr:SPFH domain-containing protein [Arachnia propionica]RRD51488.1 SPFH domain-containing protein [Arachnia propionica]